MINYKMRLRYIGYIYIQVLNEKLKTSRSQIQFNEKKADMIKCKYQEMIDAYKKEVDRLKKNEHTYHHNANNKQKNPYEEKYKQVEIFLNSTLIILLEVIEMFMSQKSSYARDSVLRTASNVEASYSIDIYDSYNNDEEKRNTLIDQIQSIVLSKLKYLQIVLKLNLEKEINKVKSWSSLNNKDAGNNTNLSFSNISNMKLSLKRDINKEKDQLSYTSCTIHIFIIS